MSDNPSPPCSTCGDSRFVCGGPHPMTVTGCLSPDCTSDRRPCPACSSPSSAAERKPGTRWGVWWVEGNAWDSVSFRCVLDDLTAMYLAAHYTAPDVPHRSHYEARPLPLAAPSASEKTSGSNAGEVLADGPATVQSHAPPRGPEEGGIVTPATSVVGSVGPQQPVEGGAEQADPPSRPRAHGDCGTSSSPAPPVSSDDGPEGLWGVWCVNEGRWCDGSVGPQGHALRDLPRWRSGEASALTPEQAGAYKYEVRRAWDHEARALRERLTAESHRAEAAEQRVREMEASVGERIREARLDAHGCGQEDGFTSGADHMRERAAKAAKAYADERALLKSEHGRAMVVAAEDIEKRIRALPLRPEGEENNR